MGQGDLIFKNKILNFFVEKESKGAEKREEGNCELCSNKFKIHS